MSRLKVVKQDICQEVERIEVLSIEADDGTWIVDKLRIHTRKGIIEAIAFSRVLPHLKTHNVGNSNESSS